MMNVLQTDRKGLVIMAILGLGGLRVSWGGSDLELSFAEQLQGGDLRGAFSRAQEKLSEDPDRLGWVYNRGIVQYRLGEWDQAILDFQSVLDRSEDPERLYAAAFNRGCASWELYRLRLREGKVDRTRSAISSDQEKEVLEQGAEVLDEAVESFCKALQWNPQDEDAAQSLEAVSRELSWIDDQLQGTPDEKSDGEGNDGPGAEDSRTSNPQSLPPSFSMSEGVSQRRRVELNQYLENLLSLPESSDHVQKPANGGKPW